MGFCYGTGRGEQKKLQGEKTRPAQLVFFVAGFCKESSGDDRSLSEKCRKMYGGYFGQLTS